MDTKDRSATKKTDWSICRLTQQHLHNVHTLKLVTISVRSYPSHLTFELLKGSFTLAH